MASDADRIVVHATTVPPALPEDLLEEIFLRLDDAADLARASAAFTCFRRVISGRPFRRRFRSLHAPPVLGFINFYGFHPAEPPHRSVPAARALARSADFTFSFLPSGPRSWTVRDVRDGLVLLFRGHDVFEDLVVCDPVHRRYVHIPQIPDELAASAGQRNWWTWNSIPFLAPAAGGDGNGDDNKEERSPFSVIFAVQSENKLVAFVFCSGNGEWRVISYLSSRSLPSATIRAYQRSYAQGCFFWTIDSMCFSLVLDIHEMKFSIMDLPPKLNNGSKRAVVDAGEGMLGLLTFDNSTVGFSRKVWRRSNDSVAGAEEWQPYKTDSFPRDSNGRNYRDWFTATADDVHVLMIGRDSQLSSSKYRWHYYILELKTLILERLCVLDSVLLSSHLYARFPPLLAPPSI